MSGTTVLAEVAAERTRQDAQWGGPAHDDTLPFNAFIQLITDYAGWARAKAREGSTLEARQRLIQVAAIAVAAAESMTRRQGSPAASVPPDSPSIDWE
ncbi:hypothetical protein ACQW02_09225 [Humitalea sp. 24SJ18S-53]|uniref:hypothetical protein n=1 Tax=Humitalea sp. 24SJ18S-53 TaxID=3422307 RepID=UPI003D67069D